MKNGLLIYNSFDYEKNKWFVSEFLRNASLLDIKLKLVFTDELIMGYDEMGLYINEEEVSFAINRSRNSIVATQLELMGIRVFNNSSVCDICNNKIKTHQKVNSIGIKSINTIFCNKKHFHIENASINFPVVLKSASGHGGSEVFIVNDDEDAVKMLNKIEENDFLIQDICENVGRDVRVFVMGGKIIAAVERFSIDNFKSNISTGGNSKKYELNEEQRVLTEKIIALMEFDFVGIDFILDKENNLIFNEIEDVVGTRSLYEQYNYDVAFEYLKYIKKIIS